MSLVFTWGTPLPEQGRAAIPETHVVFDGQWYELNLGLEFDPRNPTPKEYALLVTRFVREYSVEHPETEIRYVEVFDGVSPQLKLHCIAHTGISDTIAALPLIVAAIVAAIVAILAAVLPYIIPIAIAAFVIIMAVALYKRIAPAPNPTQCPICGETFDTYETLVAHMENVHPGAVIPKKSSDILSWLGPVLIAGVAVAAIVVIGPKLLRQST
jgi:hypothetical protein